ncbi:hypothetical protein GCM10009549_00720 [Streptomyces thermoalcalitolerans]|uniref:Transposase n=1 Tax=Streptomyces thermoalcalitolerans TaxID=65605 RepID=A0ABP3YTB7_9ACTN
MVQHHPGLSAVDVHAPYGARRRKVLLADRLSAAALGRLLHFLPGGGSEGGAQPFMLSGDQGAFESRHLCDDAVAPFGRRSAGASHGESHRCHDAGPYHCSDTPSPVHPALPAAPGGIGPFRPLCEKWSLIHETWASWRLQPVRGR